MSNYKKNIMVGVTVMASLVLLAAMIMKFGDFPARWFAKPQITVFFYSDRADGLVEGSVVLYRGVSVGKVAAVRLQSSSAQNPIEIVAMIDKEPPLPANIEGEITSPLIGGSSALSLRLVGENPVPTGTLAPDAHLTGRYRGLDILPPQFAKLAEDVQKLSQQFRESKLLEHLDQAVVSANQQINRIGKAIDSIQSMVDDPKMREDLRQSIANFRSATENANTVIASIQKISQKAETHVDKLGAGAEQFMTTAQQKLDKVATDISDRLVQVSRTLAELEDVSRKLNEGKGTAAQLLNNPALYEGLAESSKSLNSTIKDLQRLIQQWEQEGVPFKLGGK